MSSRLLGLDVGHRRIGVAIGDDEVFLAHPLLTLQHDERIWEKLQQIISEQEVNELVVGLPRGLNGQETAQTQATVAFTDELGRRLGLPIHQQDEAVTSVMAEDELVARGKPYVKDDIDALAATYILQDYLDSRRVSQRSDTA